MNAISTSAQGEPASAAKEAQNTTIKIPGLECTLPLSRWAVTAIALLIIGGVACAIYYTLIYPHIQGDNALRQKVDPFTLRQLQESQKHAGHAPDHVASPYNGERGHIDVSYYSSDGCLLVTRRMADPAIPEEKLWIQELSRDKLSPAPGPIHGMFRSGGLSLGLVTPAFAQQGAGACGGRCLSQHPGQFQSWSGERRGCWVQVWRQWPDGCKHYQWYNSCSSYWDEERRVPRLYWVCCHH